MGLLTIRTVIMTYPQYLEEASAGELLDVVSRKNYEKTEDQAKVLRKKKSPGERPGLILKAFSLW